MTLPNAVPAPKSRGLPPAAICLVGLLYMMAVAVVDYLSPPHLGLTLFYAAGSALVGWHAGRRPASAVTLAAGLIIVVHDWQTNHAAPQVWLTLWNIATRLVVVTGAGQLAAEAKRLTDNLGRVVEERTAQYKAEAQQHQATAESLRVFLDAVPEPAFLLDPQGVILVSNQALARALKVAPQSLAGRNAFSLIPPTVADLRKALFEQVLSSGKPVRYEDVRNGRNIMSFLSPVLDAQGRVTRVAVLALDITERKRAEQALADALDLNQKMIAAAPMGIAAYRASGECLFANEALARIVGGTLPQILQGNFRQLPNWQRSGLLRLAETALQQGRPTSDELHDTSRFGKTFWVDAIMAPFASGGAPHLLHMCYDITERKRLEQQILEISDREQARFGQDMHDGLCQELVSLAFDANSLHQRLADKSQPEAATAQRLASLLDQCITEARQLSRGLFPLRLEADGFHSAFEELAKTTRQRFAVDCRFKGDEQVTLQDRTLATHLYRIAQEAVNNAVRHSQAKLITIEVHADATALELKVEDDGRGVSPESQSCAAGMGMHIMDYRARTIGATLRLAAGPRGGTQVLCRLPRAQVCPQ